MVAHRPQLFQGTVKEDICVRSVFKNEFPIQEDLKEAGDCQEVKCRCFFGVPFPHLQGLVVRIGPYNHKVQGSCLAKDIWWNLPVIIVRQSSIFRLAIVELPFMHLVQNTSTVIDSVKRYILV